VSASPRAMLEDPPVPLLRLTPLATAVEFTRYCEVCDAEKTFCAAEECSLGLFGECLGCGEKGIAPFTRTVSEG